MSEASPPGGDDNVAPENGFVPTPSDAGQASAPADTPEDAAPSDPDDPAADPSAEQSRHKGGFQKRIAELTGKARQLERDAEHWREMALRTAQPSQAAQPQAPAAPQPLPPDLAQQVGAPPDPSKFPAGEWDEAYTKQRDDYVARRAEAHVIMRLRQEAQRNQQQQSVRQLEQRLDATVSKGREKFADFDDAMEDLDLLRIPQVGNFVRAQVADMEGGAEVAYYLAKNPKEAARIGALPTPFAVARELGRIEARLSAPPTPAPQLTAAPEPPPRAVRGNGGNRIDPDKLSVEQWAEMRSKGWKPS